MDRQTNQAERISTEVSKAGQQIKHSQRKRFRLPYLLRLAQRVDAFSPDCEVCRDLQSQINGLGVSLAEKPRMTGEHLKNHLRVIKGIIKHMKRKHKLAEEKQYVKRSVLLALGAGLSLIAVGLVMVSFGITFLTLNVTLPALVTRTVFSYVVGNMLDRKARKKGRVL